MNDEDASKSTDWSRTIVRKRTKNMKYCNRSITTGDITMYNRRGVKMHFAAQKICQIF